MSEQMSLTVQARAEKGKGPNRRLREQSMVPGIFYDDKGVNIPVVVADLPFRKLYKKVGSSHVFDLIIEADGKTETRPTLIWQVKPHPWKNQVEHVDFYGIDPKKPIHVNVKVEYVGKAKGVTVGGKMEIYRETLEVVCLPAAIPDKITVEVSDLAINQHISVTDLTLPEGVKAVFEQSFALVGVINPAAEAEDSESAEA